MVSYGKFLTILAAKNSPVFFFCTIENDMIYC